MERRGEKPHRSTYGIPGSNGKPLTEVALVALAIQMRDIEQFGKIELQRGSGVTRPTKHK
ncbi:hypothetical protein HYU94_03740 [Candidatus Daviesbacteria bacterium]|nr:hypothetical protein [Candidatus Daviesbacteria bacterium]